MFRFNYLFSSKLGVILLGSILGLTVGCQRAAMEEPGLVNPVFFPKPPSVPRLQFLKSFSGPDDIGFEGPGFLETFILGEPEEKDFVEKAYGGAIYRGKLYICNVGLRRIAAIDPVNKTFEFLKLDSRLVFPFNITIDAADGLKYITDPEGGAVFVYNEANQLVRILGMGLDIIPRDVCIYNNAIYITDRKKSQVVVLDKTTGELLQTFGRKAEFAGEGDFAPDEFGIISDLDVDSQGNIYVTDLLRSQVIKFDPSGRFVRTYSGPGSTLVHLLRPKGIAIDRADRIWVADSGPAEAVKIYDQEGQFLMVFGLHGQEPGQMYMPVNVIIDYDNVEMFRSYAVEGAELEFLVLVTNQYGPQKLSVYGFGTFPVRIP